LEFHFYWIVGSIVLLDILFIYFTFFHKGTRETYSKHGIYALIFILTSLSIYLPLNFIFDESIPYFYEGLGAVTVPFLLYSSVVNFRNNPAVREIAINALYNIVAMLLFGIILFLLSITVFVPIEAKFGPHAIIGCIFLLVAGWYSVPLFTCPRFLRLKASTISSYSHYWRF
jgi:hypothetical protein